MFWAIRPRDRADYDLWPNLWSFCNRFYFLVIFAGDYHQLSFCIYSSLWNWNMRVDKFREVNFILPGVLWTALAGPEQFLEHFLCPKSTLCVFTTNRWTNPSKQNLIKYLGQEMQEDAGVARICMGPFRREMHFSWEITKRTVFTFLFRCAGIPRRSVCNLQIHHRSMIPFLLFSLDIAELIHPTVNV